MQLRTIMERTPELSKHRSLSRYGDSKYDDYKYGDPQGAAVLLANTIERVAKDIQKARKLAGPWQGPAVADDFSKDLQIMLSNTKPSKGKAVKRKR